MINYRTQKTAKQTKNSPQQKYKNINYNKTKQIEFLQKLTNDFPNINPPITSIAPHFSKTNKNVGILFWYLPQPSSPNRYTSLQQQIQILTGIETCYLTDKVVPEIKTIIQKYQIYQSTAPSANTGATSPINKTKTREKEETEIYQQFSKRAKLLSKELKQPVYFDKPIAHPTTPNLWQTHFRVSCEIPKFGIIKGSIEENETQTQAIQREIQEELFPHNDNIPLIQEKIILLPQTIHLNDDSLYTFHYQVSEREKQYIENNIQYLQEENYGELVNYKFRTMTEIFNSPQSTQPNYHLLKQYFNGKSRLYISKFYSQCQFI
jgi:hypothetical protein